MNRTAGRRRRRLIVAMTGAVVLLIVGCADDARSESGASSTVAASGSPTLVGPAEFEPRIARSDVVTINVHVPNEGSIAGTDLTIPFTEISTSDQLPADLDTPLAVYCRSGNMSADAVRDLAALGYTDIVELDGGFDAWSDSGRVLTPT